MKPNNRVLTDTGFVSPETVDETSAKDRLAVANRHNTILRKQLADKDKMWEKTRDVARDKLAEAAKAAKSGMMTARAELSAEKKKVKELEAKLAKVKAPVKKKVVKKKPASSDGQKL